MNISTITYVRDNLPPGITNADKDDDGSLSFVLLNPLMTPPYVQLPVITLSIHGRLDTPRIISPSQDVRDPFCVARWEALIAMQTVGSRASIWRQRQQI
jgi:hypothetical protein